VRGNDLHRPQPLHSVISGAIQVPPNSSERSLLTCPRPWCRSGSAGQEVKLTEMARARMTARGRSRGDYVSGCIRVLPPAGYYNQLGIEPAEHDSKYKYITLVIHEDANSSLADQTHRKNPIDPQTGALANCWRIHYARRSDPSFRSPRPTCLRPMEILAAYGCEPRRQSSRQRQGRKASEFSNPPTGPDRGTLAGSHQGSFRRQVSATFCATGPAVFALPCSPKRRRAAPAVRQCCRHPAMRA
jgi:hypothetical protein